MAGLMCDDFAASRRTFLAGAGLGAAAVSTMLAEDALADQSTHFPPRARRVIWLFMAGAPSQLDTLDHKPGLQKLFDTDLPDSIRGAQRLTTMTSSQPRFPIAPSVFRFPRHGDCGKPISELFPRVGSMADDLAYVHTIHTDAINHDPAITLIQTGNQAAGHPSLGSWLNYGLGTMNRNLPSFVVLNCEPRGQALYSRLWGSGYLPSRHAGVAFRSQGDPVLYLSNPAGVSREVRRAMIERLKLMNEAVLARGGDPETRARISQYEMAFRMQASVPELIDTSSEPQHMFDLYGAKPGDGSFASNCLLARRLAERGTRFIQLYHRGWDHHGGVKKGVLTTAKHVDKASAALIRDLKDRGMLDDTLVIWGGEFGRTPMAQGSGRDHHMKGFSFWMAGGGIRGGISHGNTDDLGYHSVEDVVTVHDFHATMLHLLGIDHEKFTFKFQGLDFRLSGVEKAHILKNLIA